MVANLLGKSDIPAKVEGEYLQGGVGELQALGIVRVMVHDADEERARTIIKQWEARQPASEDPDRYSARTGSRLAWFLIGILVGGSTAGFTVYSIYNYPISYERIDYNGDGLTDSITKYKDQRIDQTKFDRNFDGNYDTIASFNRKGYIAASDSDLDFDGEFETKTFYRNGAAFRQESDTNADGAIDYVATYRFGRLREVELISPAEGNPTKRQHYRHDRLQSADYDSDGDGEFEVHYEYDFLEEIVAVERTSNSN